MKYYALLSVAAVLIASCKTHPNSDTHDAGVNDSKVYRLRLNPAAGSEYYFDIHNNARVIMEVADKKVDNSNTSDVGVNYAVSKDSSGNFVFGVTYEKIHLHSKNGDKESDMDMANAANSIDAGERMLGLLKDARITALVSPAGEVHEVTGYKELREKIMTGLGSSDSYVRNIAGKQLDLMIGDGIIKKNMAQLFAIFPDSAVRVGDKWKLLSAEKGQFNLQTVNSYILKSISDGLATVHVAGTVKSDSTSTNVMGYDVTSDLKGTQEGDYIIETATGMLKECQLHTDIKGSMQLMGKDMPLTIQSQVSVKGIRKK